MWVRSSRRLQLLLLLWMNPSGWRLPCSRSILFTAGDKCVVLDQCSVIVGAQDLCGTEGERETIVLLAVTFAASAAGAPLPDCRLS